SPAAESECLCFGFGAGLAQALQTNCQRRTEYCSDVKVEGAVGPCRNRYLPPRRSQCRSVAGSFQNFFRSAWRRRRPSHDRKIGRTLDRAKLRRSVEPRTREWLFAWPPSSNEGPPRAPPQKCCLAPSPIVKRDPPTPSKRSKL